MAKGFRPNFIFIVLLFVIIIGLGVFHHWLMKATKPCLACEGLLIPTVSEDGRRTGELPHTETDPLPTPTPLTHRQEPAPVSFGSEYRSTPTPWSSSAYGGKSSMPTQAPSSAASASSTEILQKLASQEVRITPPPATTPPPSSLFGDFSRFVSGVWKRQ